MKFSLNLLLCIFFFFFLILFFSSPSLAEPRATLAGRVCTNRTADQPNRRIFVSNFLAALDGITPQISSRRYGTTIKGTGNNTVYALGECMKDLSQRDCDQCFAQCKTDILRCLPFQRGVRGGRNYFDGCYLRRNVTVYGLAQCWETISRNSCDMCLKNASSQIQSCSRMEEGRVLNAGCYMRYSPQRFYNNSDIDAVGGGGGGGRRLAIILASVFSALAALMIFASCAFFGRRRLRRRKKERKQLGALAATVKRSDLNFKYEVLERATKYFDSSNKLGQGGSGSVYKGTLPDGKHVAVKRLIFSTRQWVDQFFNEVNLISAVHHKNLVKLLGCSITGPESLLVYEYIPNRSLQENLFSRHNNRELSWKERYNIILGTAEGLAYLHEESKLRIIHRDIKLSNILLDENFTAKIADFGLVRLFPENMSHISTAIAGTLGYMAPEYVVRGKLTEKADVYSFGVLVIEVVSGRKNNSFSQDTSILQSGTITCLLHYLKLLILR
ncbi:hypothetical protein AQUCO_00200071v1 [Aquilegia coerulea]|uniref:Protein kinase domain-containing protein n=1 Tax=Aquilegia coerulea TaxID=218851 RepID=A0A2G5F1G2_AQUCA|nr:hypothetical protein AQUCO_00200071v1 [Aquilegia coerulea]